VIAVVILIADAKGTLEPTIKSWEKKLGISVPEETVKEDVQNTTPSEYNSTHMNIEMEK
jgi:hypothetical protein